ncbi:MAG: LD-carboxypeptidase [Pseudomonadota bacterium]
MDHPRLHLIAPAGACRPLFEPLGVESGAGLLALVKEAVGDGYRVTGREALIDARENERQGGRTDDLERVADLEEALADDAVAAIVLIRGGAWFTRILHRLNINVMEARSRPVALFGFSELTSLVNIVGASRHGLGIYDMGPAFLTYGLKMHAYRLFENDKEASPRMPGEWMLEHLRPEFEAFFRDVVSMIEGRGTSRSLSAQLVQGELPGSCQATFVGGNLTVLSSLVGSSCHNAIAPAGRWLVIEDFNDKLERIDRFLAHLTLAGYWEQAEGLMLGDFHRGFEDLTPAVLELLAYHLPPDRSFPIVTTKQVGHIWPMSPLPLHLPLTLTLGEDRKVSINWPPSALRTA